MKKHALVCLLLVTVFTRCKPKHNIYYHHFNPQFWSYTDFWKKGTYWIMLDSASGQLDSLYTYDDITITKQNNYSEASDTHVWDEKGEWIIDYVGVDTFSYFGFGYTSWDYENNGINSLSFGFSRQDTIQGLQFGYYSYSYQGVITVPDSLSNHWHDLWYGTSEKHVILGLSFTELLPTYIVNNQSYDSVYHVHSIAPDSLLQLNDDFYYNRKHGILKIVQNNARIKRTLLLVRDHLIRE